MADCSAATARAAASALAACTVASGWPAATAVPSGSMSARPTRGSTASPGSARPAPRASTARPMARVSMAVMKPPRGAGTACCTGAAGSAACCSTSAGPPSAATMRANRSAAAPLSRLRCSAVRALSRLGATPARCSSCAPRASVSSSKRGSRAAPQAPSPRRKAIASCTSSALPAVRPSTWFMSVNRATVGSPACVATRTRLCASAKAWAGSDVKAPLPSFTSITSACRPAARFLLRMLAVISGMLSTVAVTSRMA